MLADKPQTVIVAHGVAHGVSVGNVASSAGWDIGEKPTVRMTYLEYPKYIPPDGPVCHRDDEEYHLNKPYKEHPTQEDEDRIAVRKATGWASDKIKHYKPLGNYEELPATGPELRVRKAQDYVKPKVVLPTAKRSTRGKGGKAEEDDDSLAQLLKVGEPVRGAVSQFSYQYYRFELQQQLNLVFHLRRIDGDPDIFISNEIEQPSAPSRGISPSTKTGTSPSPRPPVDPSPRSTVTVPVGTPREAGPRTKRVALGNKAPTKRLDGVTRFGAGGSGAGGGKPKGMVFVGVAPPMA